MSQNKTPPQPKFMLPEEWCEVCGQRREVNDGKSIRPCPNCRVSDHFAWFVDNYLANRPTEQDMGTGRANVAEAVYEAYRGQPDQIAEFNARVPREAEGGERNPEPRGYTRSDDIDNGKVMAFTAGALSVVIAYLFGKLIGVVFGG